MTDEPRTATLRTDHGTPTRAKWVAAAVEPDNTDSMATTVEGPTVRTEITRETTGGLQTTVDDYVVNLGVAQAVIEAVDDRSPGEADSSTAANQHADNRHQHE
ncbi:MAG: KEOPS complex subunit Pcc1 [Euryarchaeota archaeon]|nr:KEOPS complex subunit Pcc1 [Euryarchaeota archaeon]